MKMLQQADKVSIKIKLLVFALVAFLAILVPAYYLISSASEDVSHAESNLAGVPLAQKNCSTAQTHCPAPWYFRSVSWR